MSTSVACVEAVSATHATIVLLCYVIRRLVLTATNGHGIVSIAFSLLLFKSCTLLRFVENKFVTLDVLRTTNLCKEYSQVRKIWVFLGVAPCKRIRDP